MMFLRRISLLLLLFSASAAEAQELEPLWGTYHYQFSWGGMPVAHVTERIEENEQSYRMTSDIRTSGLVRIFDRHTSHAQTQGILNGQQLQPQYYTSHFTTNGKPQVIELTYDQDGEVVKDVQQPAREPDDPRPPVPEEAKAGSVEPLTMLLKLRRELHAALKAGETHFSFPMYDGKRLAQLHFEIAEPMMVRVGGKRVKALHVIASRQPIAGFKAKELKKIAKGEPKLHVYFSEAPQLLPVSISLDVALGTLTGELLPDCTRAQDCIQPISEQRGR